MSIRIAQQAVIAASLLLSTNAYSCDEDDRDGKPYHIDHYLSLLFKKQGDGWYLVHDQNTKIEPKAVDVAKTP